jgi:hypothetical protein
MSVQDDKGTEDDQATKDDKGTKDDRSSSRAEQADQTGGKDDEQRLTEKPEPDEDDKKVAAEMMEAYKEKPTIVLPGTGGSVSGTAVNDWLDDEGNPKHEVPDGADSDTQAKGDDAQAKGDDAQAKGDDAQSEGEDHQRDEKALQEQIEKDKALNEKLKEAAAEENKGEKKKS